MKKKKYFVITELDLIRNRHPLDSIATAHLFYGVPRDMKYYTEVIKADMSREIVFTNYKPI